MKKIMLVLFVLGISLQSFAVPKEKDVIGSWKYKVETDEGTLTGTLVFEKKEGELVGKVNTDDGEAFTFSKVELSYFKQNYLQCLRFYLSSVFRMVALLTIGLAQNAMLRI